MIEPKFITNEEVKRLGVGSSDLPHLLHQLTAKKHLLYPIQGDKKELMNIRVRIRDAAKRLNIKVTTKRVSQDGQLYYLVRLK